MKKLLIAAVLVATVSFVGYRVVAGLGGDDQAGELQFAEVTRGDLENTVSSTGTINAKGTVQIGTQVSGTIAQVYADFNDRVEAGDLLVRLDTAVLENLVLQMEANVERAEAQLDQARIDHERNQNLFARDLVAESTVQASAVQLKLDEATLKSARASLNQARTNLAYATIRSPIDGTVIQRDVEAGQTVAASLATPELFVIAEDLARVEIHALVDESDIGQVREGQTAQFTVQAYPDDEFTGTVTQVRLQPATVQNVVNYTVVVEADNERGVLLPGMTATVEFIVEQRADVLLVPNTALRVQPTKEMIASLRDRQPGPAEGPRAAGAMPAPEAGAERPADRSLVWVAEGDGIYRPVPVRTGATDGRNTEVVESRGLETGMSVVSGTGVVSDVASAGSSRRADAPPGPPRLF